MQRYTVAVIYNEVDIGGQPVVHGVIDSSVEVHDTLAALGHRASLVRVDVGIRPLVEALETLRPDVVFNLCEGYRESSAGEYRIAGLLDLLGIPYTGSGPMALAIALDKPLSKDLFIARGIPTPRFAVYREMPAGPPPLTFPLMLKLAGEDASLGITPDNVATDAPAFMRRLQELLDEYRSPVLVEEFIDGREFTVALFDGRPLPIEEIEFHVEPRIVGFRAKWDHGSAEYRRHEPDIRACHQRRRAGSDDGAGAPGLGCDRPSRLRARGFSNGPERPDLRPRGQPESRHQQGIGLPAGPRGREHFLPGLHRSSARERRRAPLLETPTQSSRRLSGDRVGASSELARKMRSPAGPVDRTASIGVIQRPVPKQVTSRG